MMLIPTDPDQLKLHTARILSRIQQEQQKAQHRRQETEVLRFNVIANVLTRQP